MASCATTPRVETFFVGAGVEQYFIQLPELRLNATRVKIDFTLRNVLSNSNPIVCNFSVRNSKRMLPRVDNAFFTIAKERADLEDVSLLYSEKEKLHSRYTSHISSNSFKALLLKKNIRLNLHFQGEKEEMIFNATENFYKALKKASETISELK